MIQALQKRFALSEQGARDLVKGCAATVLQDLSFMAPIGLLYWFVLDMMNGGVHGERIVFYVLGTAACLAFIFLAAWLQYNTTYLATYVESGVRRTSLAEHLRKLPLSFFGHKDLADLTGTIMNDCAVLETTFSHYVPALIGAIVSTTLIGICLFAFDWRMALAAVWVLPVAFAIVGFSARVQEGLTKKNVAANVAVEEAVQENLECQRDLRFNNAGVRHLNGVDRAIDHAEKRHIISEYGTAVFVVSAGLILKLGIATTALTGSVLLAQGGISLPLFFMFLLVASRLYRPLEGALQNLAAVISTRTNIGRMNDIMDCPVQTGRSTLSNKGCDIAFRNVNFAYDQDEPILENVSFTAKQGEVTALIGPSGGGKTTVSRLAARFWDPDAGRVTVGGMDISQIDPETLLTLYSIVFQNVTLFNDSVLENIRIGRKDATDAEVLEAARLANCDEFVSKLPEGYETRIGENGCELSGGERQRISIARAFLKNAPILLLDEATANLDGENETAVQGALARLIENRTVLVIAHRMRTVSGADHIVVLEEGRVSEEGTPSQLEKEDSFFSRMRRMQS